MTTTEEIHGHILKKAVEIANQAVADDPSLPLAHVYEANPIRGLCLQLIPGVPEEFKPTLRQIGVRSVKQALIDDDIRDDFAGLIIGAAKQGGNYFDFFK